MDTTQQLNRILSDSEISELVSVQKAIVKPPKKNFVQDKTNHLCVHNSFECQSVSNANDKFHIFLKKHCSLPTAFSIGLIYTNTNTLLLRANGKHKHRNNDDNTFFDAFHIHITTEKQLKAGITNSYHADITNDYANFNSALLHFCKISGIIGICDHFPDLQQITFFEE